MSEPTHDEFKHIDSKVIEATPVKTFFVEMLTRDINLEDAILDLLDNCIDGIHRSSRQSQEDNQGTPYQGFKAEIKIGEDLFSISDNCGGIPWELRDYALRMGRVKGQNSDSGSLGTYGIGMKRAIFKMGEHCLISTRSGDYQYQIEITRDWLNEDEWDLPVKDIELLEEDGTSIEITQLYHDITKQFGENAENFIAQLKRTVSTHFAYIIEKGFEIKINDKIVPSRPTAIAFDKDTNEAAPYIRPFIFKTTIDDVEVFLTVGFSRPPPSESEIEDENRIPKNSSENAGWTILCNDRVVVFNDKTILTGWGDGGVPRYHNQFIAISGVVEFNSKDPRKLPTTTTKRGLKADSQLYLQVRKKMSEGLKIFTQYTNDWKKQESESRKQVAAVDKLPFIQIKKEADKLKFAATPKIPGGGQYKPNLPKPDTLETRKKRISFFKEIVQIEKVAEYFGDSDLEPDDIGDKCFDIVYQEAKK